MLHLELAWVRHLRQVWLPGGLLVGMSTFQGEFDFGVPQFQLIYHPMLIMFAAGVTLVATRIWLGRGALFGAIAFFVLMRGGLALLVHDSLGESLPHFPIYIVEALCVEAAALLVSVRRPLAFGLTAGALIGTVGLAAEWGWSHVWMPLPWPVEILPETIALGLAMAICASIVGAWIGARFAADEMPYSKGTAARRRARRARDLRDARVPAVHAADEGHARVGRAEHRAGRPAAHRERHGHAEPAQRGRPRELAHRDGLAGRRSARRRSPEARLGGRLPHDAADPGARRLEGDDPDAQGQLDRRRADLRAAGPGDPGRRASPRRRASSAASSPTASCSSARRRRTTRRSPTPPTGRCSRSRCCS